MPRPLRRPPTPKTPLWIWGLGLIAAIALAVHRRLGKTYHPPLRPWGKG